MAGKIQAILDAERMRIRELLERPSTMVYILNRQIKHTWRVLEEAGLLPGDAYRETKTLLFEELDAHLRQLRGERPSR